MNSDDDSSTLSTPIRDKQYFFFLKKSFNKSLKRGLFLCNIFRNFKHFYLFYVCRELKKEFPNLLSYTRFVERMPRVAIPLLLFLKLGLMGECTGITFYRFYTYSCVKIRDNPVIAYSKGTLKKENVLSDGTTDSNFIFCVMNEENYSILL